MRISIELTYPQGEMFNMLKHRVPFPLFVGGYGCGKSESLVTNTIRDVMEFPGAKVGCYAPTHDLLGLNLIPRIEERLNELGINYSLQKAKHILHIQGSRQIIFRSMDNPSRIVAYEVYRSHVDEADLMNTKKKGEEAWNRIIARNRQKRMKRNKLKKSKHHFNMVSAYTTPESYRFTYERWSKNPGEGYKYVRAPTVSNWTLDDSFIKNLEDSYTPAQCKAYLLGIWTNIFTGTVYSYFDRKTMHTDSVVVPKKMLHIGADFNYGGSCCAIYRKSKNGLYMVDEFAAHDTEEMVEILKSDYSGNPITMYPDATGKSNSSNASTSDVAMLKEAGFMVKAKPSNPRITDRINSVQRLMYNGLFKINTEKCPRSVESLEEHAFSETTGLPEKFAGPATIDDRNDAIGYPAAFLYPIKKPINKRTQLSDLRR